MTVHPAVIVESFELKSNDSQNSFRGPVGKQVRLRREQWARAERHDGEQVSVVHGRMGVAVELVRIHSRGTKDVIATLWKKSV